MQSSSSLHSNPYRAFHSFTYSPFTPLSNTTYFLYRLGYIFTNRSSSITISIIVTSSYRSVCKYSPVMSIAATSFPSHNFIAEVIIIASSDTVVESEYFIFMYDYCFIQSAHVLLLILTLIFLLRTSGTLATIPCYYWPVY